MAGAPVLADEKAVWNERTKLTCTALNNIAVAMIVTGAVVPLISGLNGPTSSRGWVQFGLATWWIGIGVLMHLGAIWRLGRIKG